MRPKENYTRFVSIAFGFTLAILVTFQLYIWREPARIRADEAADQEAAIAAGGNLFAENCDSCHGENGEGDIGPALNSQDLLKMTSDDALFNLTSTGIPGTLMPAWGQAFGGPFTEEQTAQLVAFIRSWEPTAPKIEQAAYQPDPARGAAIYSRTCFICHGENGRGTEIAPALNDLERLQKLDDSWYRSTISHGRPAKGMPTWGTVLSPTQINDVVALLATWRAGETVAVQIPLATFVTNALFAIRAFDQPDAIFFLDAALTLVEGEQADELRAISRLVEDNHLFEAEGKLIALLPPEEMGKALYATNCSPCHGDDGSGETGPSLRANAYVQSKSDEELVDFILTGRSGTGMDGFEGILLPEELDNVVSLLRTWQE
jgi:mono/diheme cytochrome c family protein